MPLYWVYSSFMAVIILVGACVVYSEMMNSVSVKFDGGSAKKSEWCW